MENENYETIVVAAEHAQLKKIHDVFAVEDSVDTLFCQFEFRTEEWKLMEKTAVFIKENAELFDTIEEQGLVRHEPLDGSNTCAVPAEVLSEQGYFSVGVFGINGDEVLPTNLVRFKCHAGCYSDETLPPEPTQALYQWRKALKTLADGKASRKTFTATISASSWSSSAPYTNTVSISGILSTDMPHVMATVTSGAIKESWGCVDCGVAGENSITFTALTDKPSVDIPIQVEVIR